ncbi:MAG: VRR-NUC domain-containing protein [Muribaculaceae bacterium]|nr:VRR-NUC domain-containing protein [Muribaculaceae bacterium]
MAESEIERKLGKEIKKLGGLYYKFVSPNLPGVPDRIVIMPGGRVIFVELKTEIGRLSNIQKWVIEEMRQRGADVRVIKGWPAARAFLDELKKEEA